MKKAVSILNIFILALGWYSCNSNTNSNSVINLTNNTNSINYPELLPNSALSFKSDFNGIIFVTDDSGYRYLKFGRSDDDNIQSKISISDKTELCFYYTKTSMLGLALFESPEIEIYNILMIGLGGGSMPRFLMKCLPKIKIDSVEIDPAVVAVAKHYLFVDENENHKIIIQDGRKFVESTKKKYDIIFLDAFNAEDSIPHQLMSIEFLNSSKNCLSKNGLMITNFINYNQKIYESIFKSYKASFKHVMRFNLLRFNRRNIIIMAFDDDAKNLSSQEIKKKIEKSPNIFDAKYDFRQYADVLNSDELSFINADIIRDN